MLNLSQKHKQTKKKQRREYILHCCHIFFIIVLRLLREEETESEWHVTSFAAVPHTNKWTIFLSGTWTFFFSQIHQVVLHVRFYARVFALVMFPKFDPIWNWMFRMKAVPLPLSRFAIVLFPSWGEGGKRALENYIQIRKEAKMNEEDILVGK